MQRFILLAALVSIQCIDNPCDISQHLTTNNGLEKIRHCKEITGNITVADDNLTSFILPNLVSVRGNLSVHGASSLTNVNLKTLREVNGSLNFILNAALTTVDIPQLESVGEKLWIIYNSSLPSFELLNLTSVNGDMNFSSNDILANISLPILTTIEGSLTIGDNNELGGLGLDALTRVTGDYVRIGLNPILPTCQAEAVVSRLVGFTGEVYIGANNDAGVCPD